MRDNESDCKLCGLNIWREIMRRYTILYVLVLLAIVTGISFGQNNSGSSNSTAETIFYNPTDRLEYIIRSIYEDTMNEADISRLEEEQRKSLADGFAGPWQNLVPKLTREECAKMTTPELAKVCFETSIFSRLQLIYNRPITAFIVAKVRYPCYEELFNRDDLWKGVLEAYSLYSSGLDPKGEPNDVIDAVMGLINLPLFFQYPPMRQQLEGREILFVRAQLDALKNIRSFIKDDKDDSTVSAAPFFSVATPIELINYSLVFIQKLSPDKSKSVIDKISKIRLSKTPKMKEVKDYIDISIIEIEKYLKSYEINKKS